MLNKILLITLLGMPILSSAQNVKVKIKKDQLLLNEKVVGNWQSVGKFLRNHEYHFKSLENKPILTFEDASIRCFFNDTTYHYTKITIHELNKVTTIEEYTLQASNNIETTVAKFMVNDLKFINAEGALNTSIVNEYLKNNPDTIPERVKMLLAYQKEMSKDQDFIVSRDLSKPVIIEPIGGCAPGPNFHTVKCFGIFQNKTQIGYARLVGPNQTVSGWEGKMRLEFYNSKNARIGVYKDWSFPTLIVYKPKVNLGFMKHEFKKLQGSESLLVSEISKWLVAQQYL